MDGGQGSEVLPLLPLLALFGRRYGGGFWACAVPMWGILREKDAVSSRLKARSRETASKKPRLPGETK
jgi:hypothetical protein